LNTKITKDTKITKGSSQERLLAAKPLKYSRALRAQLRLGDLGVPW
jgi:hypothetical protein